MSIVKRRLNVSFIEYTHKTDTYCDKILLGFQMGSNAGKWPFSQSN